MQVDHAKLAQEGAEAVDSASRPECQPDDRVLRDRPTAVQLRRKGEAIRPLRDGIATTHQAWPVQDHAQGAVVVVLQDQHDGPVEVGVQQLGSGQQQAGLRGGHRPASWRASPSSVFAPERFSTPTSSPPANSV